MDESLEEATFLWKRWEAELGSLTRNLDEVWVWTEDRLHGALDGARAADDELAARIIEPAFAQDDPALWTVAAHLAAALSSDAAREVLASSVRTASGARLAAIARGIETADLNGSFAPVTRTLLTGGAQHRAVLARIRAFRRAPPGPELAELLHSGSSELVLEALQAAATAQDESLDAGVRAVMRSDDPAVRSAAIACGIRRRLSDAWSAACEAARVRAPEAGALLSPLAMFGGADEHALIMAALREPKLRKDGLYALGHVGTREATETCLAGMREPELARVAGEAYCAITGADLERDGLAAVEKSQSETVVPFETDDLAADLIPAAEASWPLPDLEAVRRHWEERKASHAPGVRYLRGRPANLDVLMHSAEEGPMLRRADAILELAVRSAGRYDVEPRAFVSVQRRMMAAARIAASGAGAS